LAGYRRARGLAANSLNWSAWTDAAADPRVARQLARYRVIAIPPEQGLAAFERTLALGATQIAIVPAVPGESFDGPLTRPPAPRPLGNRPSDLLARLRDLSRDKRKANLTQHIVEHAAAILGCSVATLDGKRGFFEQGLDSLRAIELCNRLQREFPQTVPTTLPFTFPTPAALSDELLRQTGLGVLAPAAAQVPLQYDGREPVAIVAINCRMPGGVTSPEEFWTLLHDGVDAITEVPSNRWDIAAYYDPDPEASGSIVTRNGGFVADVDQFDPIFFGISPREACQMDPQHRLLLEVCWELLERAGIPASCLQRSETGVFIGISTNDYLQRLNRQPE